MTFASGATAALLVAVLPLHAPGRVLRQLYPTVPEEEIGLHARWTIEQDNRTPGYTTKTETAFTVTALEPAATDLAMSTTSETSWKPVG